MALLVGEKVTLRRSLVFKDGTIAKCKDGSFFFELEDFTIEAVDSDKAYLKSLIDGHTEEVAINQ